MSPPRGWIRSLLLCTVLPCVWAGPAQAAENLKTAIGDLSRQLSDQLATRQIKKIAITEFTDLNGFQSALGLFVAEDLVTQLLTLKPGALDIVERRSLTRVLAEQKLTETMLIEKESIARVGKILGIEAIIIGFVTDFGDQVQINAKAIAVDTALLFAAASTTLPKADSLTQLMRQAVSTAAPATVAPLSVSPTLAQHSGAYFQNDFLRVEVRSLSKSADGKFVNLALSFENLLAEEIAIAIDERQNSCDGSDAVRVVDDRGNSSEWTAVTGVSCVGLGVYGEPSGNRTSYTTISPKSRTAVTLWSSFGDGKVETPGSRFSFSANLGRHLDKTYSRFSVGIADIVPSN